MASASAGIHGEGEVVGIGDSGIDTGHCFFEQVQGDTMAAQNYGPEHRKIVAYRAYADGTPGTGQRDHGTHVAGSVLGNPSIPEGKQRGETPGTDEVGAMQQHAAGFHASPHASEDEY